MSRGVPVFCPETQEIWKTNTKANQNTFNTSNKTLNQNLGIFFSVCCLLIVEKILATYSDMGFALCQ